MGARRAIKTGVVAALALCLGLPVLAARAELPASAADLSKIGHEKFDAVAAQAKAKGDLPRLVVPDEAAILNAFWDMKTLLGTSPYRKGDIATLMDMFQKRTGVLNLYVTYVPNGVKEPDADRNLSVFQDEIFRSMQSLLMLCGAVIPSLGDMIGKRKASDLNKQMTDGARQVKTGLFGIMNGGLQMVTHPGLKSENQSLVVDVLAEKAEVLAGGMSKKERDGLAETARASMPTLHPAAQERLQVFLKALSTATCEGLCRIE